MNYFSVIEKRTEPVRIQVYDSSLSNFEIQGKLSIKRLCDNMGCDNGVEFYCEYDGHNLKFTSIDLVPSIMHTLLNSLKGNDRDCFNYPLNLQGKENYVKIDGKNIPMQLLFLKTENTRTVDFVIQINNSIIIEVTDEAFEKIVKQFE